MMMANTLEIVQETAREIFENDEIVLTKTTKASDVAEWDSFNHVRLIIALEELYSVSFPAGEVADLNNVKDLLEMIERYI
jgi:acyl carrier protein